jgi:hypothetical protein
MGWQDRRSFSLLGEQSSPRPLRLIKEAIVENLVTAPIRLQRRASLPASINSPRSVTMDINNGYDTVTKNEVHIAWVHYGFVSVNENS